MIKYSFYKTKNEVEFFEVIEKFANSYNNFTVVNLGLNSFDEFFVFYSYYEVIPPKVEI